ncbi:MAG: hypothetical protein IPK97_15075 [Ahniella sp.]|nr:hypothetical protein [Ahniella sp.]
MHRAERGQEILSSSIVFFSRKREKMPAGCENLLGNIFFSRLRENMPEAAKILGKISLPLAGPGKSPRTLEK